MKTLLNFLKDIGKTIAWFVKDRVVWHHYFERIVVKKFKLVRQEATLNMETGSIKWVDK